MDKFIKFEKLVIEKLLKIFYYVYIDFNEEAKGA